MTIKQMKCPACGSTIDVKEDQKTFYCSYCGSKLYFDDEVKRVEVYTTEHKIYTDEAKIKENLRMEKELDYKDKKDIRDNRMFFGFILFMFFLLFLSFFFLTFIDSPGKNKVKMPMDAKAYQGENYEEVVQELEDMGFRHIETIPKKDLIIGLITKDGEVAKISIAGDSQFEEGDIFSKDADVIITYHTFKK